MPINHPTDRTSSNDRIRTGIHNYTVGPFYAVFAIIFGFSTLLTLGLSCYGLVSAYLGSGIDIELGTRVGIGFYLLLIAGSGAYVMRPLAAQWGLRRRLAAEVVYAEYLSKYPPAIASLVINRFDESRAYAATLLDLKYRGYLSITAENGHLLLRPLKPADAALSKYEALVLVPVERAKAGLAILDARQVTDIDEAVYQEALARDLIRTVRMPHWLQAVLSFLNDFSVIVFLFQFAILTSIFQPFPHLAPFSEGPIHYPVHTWELAFIILVTCLYVGVVGQAYNSLASSNRGLTAEQEAAGLYLYIKTVFKRRYTTLAPSEMARYYPYTTAFGLDDTFIKQMLSAPTTHPRYPDDMLGADYVP